MDEDDKNPFFDKWNMRKKELEQRQADPLFMEREIWWCALGINIGSEQDGKSDLFERPVIILRKFYKNMILVLPLTSTKKYGSYYLEFKNIGESSTVILSQVRTISNKRLLRKIRTISTKDYLKILFQLMRIILFP